MQDAAKNNKYTFTGTYNTMDTALYLIQFYCYNVESLMFVFWVTGLFRSAWRVRITWIDRMDSVFGTIGKILAVLLPALIIGIARTTAVLSRPTLYFIISDILLVGGVLIGMTMLVLVLYKYVSVRQRLSSNSNGTGILARLRWRLKFAVPSETTSKGGCSGVGQRYTSKHTAERGPRTKYDKWLIFRFTICFTILCIFEIFLIFYEVMGRSERTKLLNATAPDYSVGKAVTTELIFMPGVTTGLMIFLVFGTTGALRAEYSAIFRRIFFCGRKSSFSGAGRLQSDSVVRLTDINTTKNSRKLNEWQEVDIFNPTLSSGNHYDLNERGKGPGAEYTVTIESRAEAEPDSPPRMKRSASKAGEHGNMPRREPPTEVDSDNAIYVSQTFTTKHV